MNPIIATSYPEYILKTRDFLSSEEFVFGWVVTILPTTPKPALLSRANWLVPTHIGSTGFTVQRPDKRFMMNLQRPRT